MAWRDIENQLRDLDVAAPSEFYNGFTPFMAELGGRIDRDNLGLKVVTNDKIVLDTADRVVYVEETNVVRMLPDAPSSSSELTTLLAATIDAEEWLVIRASGYCRFTATDTSKIEFYLTVDNVIVGILEPMRLRNYTAYEFEAHVPVTSGTHRIEVLGMTTRYYRSTVAQIGGQAEVGTMVVAERRR